MTSTPTTSAKNRRRSRLPSNHQGMTTGWIQFLSLFLLLTFFANSEADTQFQNHLDAVRSSGGLKNRFFALRHGQSQANVAKIIASDPKIACVKYGLSKEGKVQAQQAGTKLVQDFLQARKDDLSNAPSGIVIVCSDLTRAKETAEALVTAVCEHNESASKEDEIPLYIRNDGLQLSTKSQRLTIDTRLRERWFGEWDGKSDKHYHDVWKDDVKNAHHTKRGVESVWSVVHRATKLVCEYDSLCNEGDFWIICVAHGDVLQILQTSFCSSMDPKDHRSLEHLETAIMRPLELD